MELECYPLTERPPELVPGRPQRAWMERFADRHPYAGGPGHYAAYLEDADGFEVEVVAGQ